MNQETVYLSAYWRDRRTTAREFIETCHRFLAALSDISASFANRCVVVGSRPVGVPTNYAAFESLLAKLIANPECIYENPDAKAKEFTLDSAISTGFLASFSDPSPRKADETGPSIRIIGGSWGEYQAPNSVVIEFPGPLSASGTFRELAVGVMEQVLRHWHPHFACVTSTELFARLDGEYRNDFTVGMINYFADPRVVHSLGDESKTIQSEFGGAAFAIDVDPPFLQKPDQFLLCYERLDRAGLLRWPTAR
ncbi:MAG: hypothetical protein JNK85_11625 [Verrucomicrobiales bacterium]|nr:hypothetical protein [Verrucomicrobiales bacterium]